MLSGKRFKLSCPTTGLEHIDGTAILVTIPSEGCITVLSGPNGSERDKGLIYVLWEDRRVALFAVDVAARGMEIRDVSGGQSATG